MKKKVLGIKHGYRNWIYAEDVVNPIILTMTQNKSSEYIMNSGRLVNTNQVVKRACTLLNKKNKIKSITSQKNTLRIKGKNLKIPKLEFKNKFIIDDIILNIFQN